MKRQNVVVSNVNDVVCCVPACVTYRRIFWSIRGHMTCPRDRNWLYDPLPLSSVCLNPADHNDRTHSYCDNVWKTHTNTNLHNLTLYSALVLQFPEKYQTIYQISGNNTYLNMNILYIKYYLFKYIVKDVFCLFQLWEEFKQSQKNNNIKNQNSTHCVIHLLIFLFFYAFF